MTPSESLPGPFLPVPDDPMDERRQDPGESK